MRIELPSPSWADAHRAQDDAHTLTLPAQRAVSLAESLLGATAGEASGVPQRVEVRGPPPVALTLTL